MKLRRARVRPWVRQAAHPPERVTSLTIGGGAVRFSIDAGGALKDIIEAPSLVSSCRPQRSRPTRKLHFDRLFLNLPRAPRSWSPARARKPRRYVPSINEVTLGQRVRQLRGDAALTLAALAARTEENEILSSAPRVIRQGCHPKMRFTFIAQRCSDVAVAACCRAMQVTTSGVYKWRQRQADPAPRVREDRTLTATIVEIHRPGDVWLAAGTRGSAAARISRSTRLRRSGCWHRAA